MGILDLPAPLFTAVDGMLDFLPPLIRLLVWAAFTGAASMGLYWLCSAQDKVGAAKQRAISARKAMAAFDGDDFAEMMPLAVDSLASSGKHFLIVLVPAVLSSLPALTLIVWVSNQYGYTLPEAGNSITLSSTAPLAGLESDSPPDNIYSMPWPTPEQPVILSASDGVELTQLPLTGRVPVVHKQLWWNALIGNPNGYLPDDSNVDAVYFSFAPIEFFSVGPSWARSWEVPYFLLLMLVSLGVKVTFKIH